MGINSKAWKRQAFCLATAVSLFAIVSVGLGGWAHTGWQIPGIETDAFTTSNRIAILQLQALILRTIHATWERAAILSLIPAAAFAMPWLTERCAQCRLSRVAAVTLWSTLWGTGILFTLFFILALWLNYRASTEFQIGIVKAWIASCQLLQVLPRMFLIGMFWAGSIEYARHLFARVRSDDKGAHLETLISVSLITAAVWVVSSSLFWFWFRPSMFY